MATFHLPYGRKQLTFALSDTLSVELLKPGEVSPVPDPVQAVQAALTTPVGCGPLSGWKGVKSAAIAINDKTRPVPHAALLPPLLQQLEEEVGLPARAISLIIASGTHPPMSPDEYPAVVPAEILARYPVLCHDAYDRTGLVYLGQSQQGTPVWLNRHFAQADLRLVVGNIEPHQFVGFSGGVKSAAIGLAGYETVNHNHAMMVDPKAQLGRFEDNPTRQDIEEIGQMAGVHFALNVILNKSKQMVAVIAGAPQAVMEHGMPLVRRLYQVEVARPFDLVIASPGGHPKDINLYQAQKGLAHAALAARDGGTIILAAACPEGTGSHKYEAWMEGLTSYQAVFDRFRREGFQVGPHKAFQICRDADRVRVLLVSDMPADFVRRLLLTPVADLDQALALVLPNLPAGASIGVMPWANATMLAY